jgi:UDP-N-acetylmuramate dehydrogenase
MVLRNIPLKSLNTFGHDYKAEYFVYIKSETEAVQLAREGAFRRKPLLVLGGGSNLLFISDFNGIILHPVIEGIYLEEESTFDVIVSAGAGVNWDHLTDWAVARGFGGLENLSLIPGTVGAAPVQNIGAYGVEVKDSVLKVRAVEIKKGTLREFSREECSFGYRNSIFKGSLRGRYLITRVVFRLQKRPELFLDYGTLKQEAEKIGPLSLRSVRQAVINIRTSKLPDPGKIGNAGSFFKNPVITKSTAGLLSAQYPSIPLYDDSSGRKKVSAGWLIEQCGWKGRRVGDAGVHEKQALVLVNHGNATGREILDLSEQIRHSVNEKFGIMLEREVEVVGEHL